MTDNSVPYNLPEIKLKTSHECEIKLVSHTNTDDLFPATAARVSYNNDLKEHSYLKDKKLIEFLAEHQHFTPFEYQHATIMIECPLFVRSQIHRHRTFSYNEISRRYTSDDLVFWRPDTWRKQDTKNKQGSVADLAELFNEDQYKACIMPAFLYYEKLLNEEIGREQARAVLPQSLITRFYMGGNLRNWAHFLDLRLDPHAQLETRIVADRIKSILTGLWPVSLNALSKSRKENESKS